MNSKTFWEIFRENTSQWTNTIVSKGGSTRNAIFSDDLFLTEDCPLAPSTWLNTDRFQAKARGDAQQTTIQLLLENLCFVIAGVLTIQSQVFFLT